MRIVIERLMSDFGLGFEEVGEVLGLNSFIWHLLLRVIYNPWPRWLDNRLLQLLGAKIAKLQELDLRLKDTFEQESIKDWIHQFNPDLRQKPIEALKKSGIDEVFAAIESLDSGVYI